MAGERGGETLHRTYVGVAGWDYPDWEGIVYPRGGRVDRLATLARFVDAVEVNATFYRPVPASVSRSWVRRTAHREGFRFTAKGHRSWTHEPEAPLAQAVARTLEGLEPLREAGRLGAVLVQFPQRFHFRPESLQWLESLLAHLEGWPVVVEVRHASWARREAGEWFREHGIGWCAVDQPRVGRSTLRPLPRVTGPVAYFRCHGRNARDWFREDAGRDARYDYLYSWEELDEIRAMVSKMAEQAEELYVILNNHFRGKALANALQLKHRLSGERVEAPPDLVRAYPDLAPAVRTPQPRLF